MRGTARTKNEQTIRVTRLLGKEKVGCGRKQEQKLTETEERKTNAVKLDRGEAR